MSLTRIHRTQGWHKCIWSLFRPPLIKSKHENNSDKDFVKLNFNRDPTSSSLDLYEFKIDLFYNSKQKEFLLFVWNFSLTLAASGTLSTGAKNKYLHTLVRWEEVCKFDLLSVDVEVLNPITVETIVLGLASYFFLWTRCQIKSARCATERGSHAV